MEPVTVLAAPQKVSFILSSLATDAHGCSRIKRTQWFYPCASVAYQVFPVRDPRVNPRLVSRPTAVKFRLDAEKADSSWCVCCRPRAFCVPCVDTPRSEEHTSE